MWKWAAGGACLLLSTAAQADWYRASSDHFVVYADDSAKDVQKFAEMLERYHAAMSFVTSGRSETPSPSNRVTIYAVGSEKELQALAGDSSGSLQGFYIPRAGGSRAFVRDIRASGRNPDVTLITLLHEYAHHYLISSSRFGMPRWLSEGSAEFFASASFDSKGGVVIGRPANHRAGELAYADEVTIRELLDEDTYRAKERTGYDSFYGRSWLLYHYLTFEKARKGQLQDYWVRMAKGQSSLEAAGAAFGDLDQLEGELARYQKSRRMSVFSLNAGLLPVISVQVTAVSRGLSEMMPVLIRSQRGVSREQALELVIEARAIASRHSDDADVLAALAETEFDAGNDEEAIAAADRALAINPKTDNALIQKGYALFELARLADDADQAYLAAVRPFQDLNRLENDHPIPLIYFYRSLQERGAPITEIARNALYRASELAPFDHALAMQTGMMLAQAGYIGPARSVLQPVAFNPHGGELANRARTYFEVLKGVPEGESFDLGSVVVTPEVDVPDLPSGG